MTEIFALAPVPIDEQAPRVPDDLPLATPARDKLEDALRESGYAIVAIDPTAAAPADTTELRKAVAAVVNEADQSEVARLEAAAAAESLDDLDERFWGAAPDSVTVVTAVLADLSDQFAQRQQLADDGITRDATAELLGITAQSVTAKLAARKLVGIKLGREWRLPTWQFDPDVATGVLPDLDTLQAVFPGGPVTLSQWMLKAQPEFDGRSAREEMIVHGSTPVIELAQVLTATAW
jgi:hypothetical protein